MYNRPIGALDARSQMLCVGVLGMKIEMTFSCFKLNSLNSHPSASNQILAYSDY